MQKVEELKMTNKVFPTVHQLVDQVEQTQQENIEAAAQAVAQCIIDGGIIQAWGGGHSMAGAMEVAHLSLIHISSVTTIFGSSPN